MSDTYTPNPANNPTSYQHPEDGELADVASILAFLEGLADKCAHILEGNGTEFSGTKSFVDNVEFQQDLNVQGELTVETGGALTVAIGASATIADGASLEVEGTTHLIGPTTISSATVTFDDASPEVTFDVGTAPIITFAGTAPQVLFDNNVHVRTVGGVAVDATGAVVWPTGATLAASGRWVFMLTELPNGAALRKVGIRWNPADNTLPTTKGRLQVYRKSKTSTVVELIATATDPATGASYQAVHDFEADITADNIELDLTTYVYFLWLVGESGTDSDNIAIEGPPWIEYAAGSLDLGR